MKTDDSVSSSAGVPLEKRGDQTKLVSLLALATGAVVIPQTGRADIFYTDLSSSPVTVSPSGINSYTFSLPGGAQFGFTAYQAQRGTSSSGIRQFYYRTILAGQQGGSISAGIQTNGNSFAVTHSQGDVWSGQSAWYSGVVAFAGFYKILGSTIYSTHQPGGYAHKYLAYEFDDGGTTVFGWADVSLNNGPGADPSVTIYGYAYDSSGNPITIGVVPEPASMSILALGALMLGAKGLRTWRRNRAEARQP